MCVSYIQHSNCKPQTSHGIPASNTQTMLMDDRSIPVTWWGFPPGSRASVDQVANAWHHHDHPPPACGSCTSNQCWSWG